MIKIVIIEDEIPARNKIIRFLKEINEEVKIMAELDNVATAIEFLKSENNIDLIFSDIELLDGNAFEIYHEVKVNCPIIFTTAYDQFWMNAFESNGIEYLLKPFSVERFTKAWNKFLLLSKSNQNSTELISKLNQIIHNELQKKLFKEKFTISTSQGIYFIETSNIVLVNADQGLLFAHDNNGKKHILNEDSISSIESLLNPETFFKINRSQLINKYQIEKIERYSKNSLAITLTGYKEHLKTSQSTTSAFRKWIEK